MDSTLEAIRRTGRVGELRFKPEHRLPKSATEYFHQNVWLGVSFPKIADAEAARTVLGYDNPHNEGTHPYTTLALRQVFHDWPEPALRTVLAENAASVYGFDLAKLAEHASRLGPAVSEIAQPLTELPDNPNEALLANVA